MKKYDGNKIFDKNNQFTKLDELKLTCATLGTSIKSNYFSLKDSDTDKLSDLITQTIDWLTSYPNEPDSIYEEKINNITTICNQIYHSMHKMKVLETVDVTDMTDMTDTESDTELESDLFEPVPENNKIKENLDTIIENLPQKPSKKKSSRADKAEILLKVDIQKLSSDKAFSFKN
jgi:hypothetical protein